MKSGPLALPTANTYSRLVFMDRFNCLLKNPYRNGCCVMPALQVFLTPLFRRSALSLPSRPSLLLDKKATAVIRVHPKGSALLAKWSHYGGFGAIFWPSARQVME